MFRLPGIILTSLAIGGLSADAQAQRTHTVRMEADAGQNEYRFAPASVTARPGDVVVFSVVNGAPHSIVFESGKLAGADREALNAAMPRRSADLAGPLLTENGSEYRLTVPQLPEGVYRFFCLPHRAYDERGELRIVR